MSSLHSEAAHTLGTRALSSMAYGYGGICAAAMIMAPSFFRYWIGADFALVSAPVAQVLFPGIWMAALSLVAFTLLQSQGRADVTGKLNIVEFVPFVAVLWGLTHAFGLVGAAAAWSLRCTVDALAMFWASGMTRKDLLPLLPSGAVLMASLVVAQFLGFNILIDVPVAALAATAASALGYLFSEDWRSLTVAQVNQARIVLGGLTSRGKPISPVNTNAQNEVAAHA